MHRVPIDCMTAEDWQRAAKAKQERAATVYVVNHIGDQDCGWDNPGVIGVFGNPQDAWEAATAAAKAEALNMNDDYWRVDEKGIHLGRGEVEVKKMHVG